MLALEIGNGQYNSVSQILKYQGYKELFLVKDYEDNIRCILAELKNWKLKILNWLNLTIITKKYKYERSQKKI